MNGAVEGPDQEELVRSRVALMFYHMQGNSKRWGSEMAAHMPSLALLSRNWSFGDVVELGVGQGYSTCALLAGLEGTGKTLLSYDQNPFVPESVLKIMGASKSPESLKWQFKVSDSIAAAKEFRDNSISMLFIDTDHRYEPTVGELEAFLPKIHPRGIIVGHDYYLEKMGDVVCGVMAAVDEFSHMNRQRFRLQVLPHDEGLFILWPH